MKEKLNNCSNVKTMMKYMYIIKNSATAFNGVKKEEFEGKGVFNNTITSLIFRILRKTRCKNTLH